MKERQIIALGGGGFSEEPECPLLDDYVLEHAGHPCPRVCFVPTASGDSQGYIDRFVAAFAAKRCEPTHLALFRRTIDDLRSFVLAQHVIYVGGGNTASLLAVWRAHGLDRILREAWEAGIVLCGISAGSLCWFEGGVTDSFGRGLQPLHDGLGLLPASHCPHYGEPERRQAYQQHVGAGSLPGGVAAEDGVALHFVGDTLAATVSSRSSARAYSVALEGGCEVRETPIVPRYLGVAEDPGG